MCIVLHAYTIHNIIVTCKDNRLYDWNFQWKYEPTFEQQKNDWRKVFNTYLKNGKSEYLCFCICVCMCDVTCVECLDRMLRGSISPSLNGLRGVHLWVTYFQHPPPHLPPPSVLVRRIKLRVSQSLLYSVLIQHMWASYGLSLQCTLYTQSYGIISDWGSILEYKKLLFL